MPRQLILFIEGTRRKNMELKNSGKILGRQIYQEGVLVRSGLLQIELIWNYDPETAFRDNTQSTPVACK
jgi:hypothetical protein